MGIEIVLSSSPTPPLFISYICIFRHDVFFNIIYMFMYMRACICLYALSSLPADDIFSQCMFSHIYIYMYIYIYVCICLHARMYLCKCVCTSTSISAQDPIP